jgi:hypothetical protein
VQEDKTLSHLFSLGLMAVLMAGLVWMTLQDSRPLFG